MKSDLIIMVIVLLLFSCVILGILTYVPETKIRQSFGEIFTTFEVTTKTTVVISGIGISLALVVGLLWLIWIAYQSGIVWHSVARMRRAEALHAERDAALVVTVAPAGSQVYASEVSGVLNLIHKPLYLAAGNVNGKEVEPSLAQVRQWSFFQLTQSINKPDKTIIESGLPALQAPLPSHVDLADHINGVTSLESIFLGIGRYPDGRVEPIRRPLNTLVHVACGGSSGFGKSVFMQSLGYQAIHAKEECEPTFLDAQAVTFQVFSNDERLHYPIASEEKDIQAVLADLVDEMNRRKDLYSQWRGVFSLTQYNRVADEPLPTLPVFFDEFGILAKSKAIARLVDILAKGGRKFGLYLLASSQTWYANEIASSLKANLSTAVQFYLPGKSQSRVLLEDSRAVELTKPGQAFCRLPGQVGLIEMQVPDCSSLIDVTPMLVEAHTGEMPTIKDEPSEQEQAILDLWDSGNTSKPDISQKVFGSVGGNQYKKIEETLSKFGRI